MPLCYYHMLRVVLSMCQTLLLVKVVSHIWINSIAYFSNFLLKHLFLLMFQLIIKNDRAIKVPPATSQRAFSGSSLNNRESKSESAQSHLPRGRRKTKPAQIVKRFYQIPVMKVRDKADAFFQLRQSARFMAFYSISFPSGTSEDICFQLFNTWLTRVRKTRKDFEYLWIAERQGNNTVHFHMLTHCFLNIRVVNHFMAAAIQTQVQKGNMEWGNSSKELYNGVDVKHVHNAKGVSRYLTKYMTKRKKDENGVMVKEYHKFNRLAWHCSRRVSALFTSRIVSGDYLAELIGQPWFSHSSYICSVDERAARVFDVFYFTKSPPRSVLQELRKINQRVFDGYHDEQTINNLISNNYGKGIASFSEIVLHYTPKIDTTAKVSSAGQITRHINVIQGDLFHVH